MQWSSVILITIIWMWALWRVSTHALEGIYAGTRALTSASAALASCIIRKVCVLCALQVRAPGFDGLVGKDGL